MTTISYPSLGVGGFAIDKWATYFDGDDGIINDYTGGSLALTRISSGDIARYSLGQVRVGGYVLEVTANHDLVVSTTAGTYYTWACYTPASNVADGSGNAIPAGPVSLGISSGSPSTTGGKQYFLLDKIVRTTGQALTAATVTSYRRWVGPHVYMDALPVPLTGQEVEFDLVLTGFGPYPIGSVLSVRSIAETFDRLLSGGSVVWRARSMTAPVALPLRSGLVANTDPPQYWMTAGGDVRFRGTVKRASGSNLTNGADVLLADLPAGFRPTVRERGPITAKKSGSGWDQVNISVGSDGVMTLYDPDGFEVDWVDLSKYSYRTKG